MRIFNKLFKFLKLSIAILPVLTRNQLRRYAPAKYFPIVDGFLTISLRVINKKTVKFVPITIAALLANYCLEFNQVDKALLLVHRAQRNPKSRRLAYSYEIEIATGKSLVDRNNELLSAISDQGINEGRFEAAMLWAFWNLSHYEYADYINAVITRLEERNANSDITETRLLPEFTSNMGHLGYLVSYLKYYKNEDPNRVIELWPDQSPNKFFIDLVMEQSPLKVVVNKGKPTLSHKQVNSIDSLIFSRRPSGQWRFEHNAAVCSGQNFPELQINEGFHLNFPTEKNSIVVQELERIGFNPNKWFVILHIRESIPNNFGSTQARDSEIEKYSEFCKLISDLGGQVVRMGNTSFPRMSRNMLAIDYAHSEYRSDIIDCWLWANCKWWTGNANGASLAAYAFGAPRLIVDQWFWDNFGPSRDLYITKIAIENGIPLSIDATFSHSLSRNMNLKFMNDSGLELRGNTSDQIVQAGLDMYQQLLPDQSIHKSQVDVLDQTLSKFMRNNHEGQMMRIAPSFRGSLSYLI